MAFQLLLPGESFPVCLSRIPLCVRWLPENPSNSPLMASTFSRPLNPTLPVNSPWWYPIWTKGIRDRIGLSRYAPAAILLD